MFFHQDIKGDRLPPKTVCLTYDDGPGPQTAELGHFLHEVGISATFFAIGRHIEQDPGTVRRLREWGNLVGSHTWSHPGLGNLVQQGGDPTAELERTAAVLRDGRGGMIFFRPPYGNWRAKTRPDGPEDALTSPVAEALERSGRLRDHVGPIKWEIVGEDWDCWRRGVTPEEAARRHVAAVERAGKGILLLHDSSDEGEMRARNQTFALTRLLVPALKDRGYQFVRLDAIPQVRSAMRVTEQLTLRVPGRGYLIRRGDEVLSTATAGEGRELFGVVEMGNGRIALRAGHGLFLSVRPGGEVYADALETGDAECLEQEDLDAGHVAFRTGDGRYLGCVPDGTRFIAGSKHRGDPARFEVGPLFVGS